MSKIHVSKDDIIHLAHSVIQAMHCEWGDCTITLNSWNTLAKNHLVTLGDIHLLRHCSQVAQQGGVYECKYSRCSGRLHNTPSALKTHMELSHLSRVALVCPARGCKEVFIRVQQFHSHFDHTHNELMNKRVSIDALAPLADLAPPRRLRQPSPLSNHHTQRKSLFAPVLIRPRGASQSTVPRGLSRRWSRLDVQDEDESDEDPIAFPDLTSFQCNISEPEVIDTEVQSKLPLAWRSLLSRSQPVVYPPVRSTSPEQSILYPAFASMVDKQVATGTLAGHKEAGMQGGCDI